VFLKGKNKRNGISIAEIVYRKPFSVKILFVIMIMVNEINI